MRRDETSAESCAPPQTDTVVRATLELAATQLEFAMREASTSVDGLADALERLAAAIEQVRADVPHRASDLDAVLSVCVQHLQFHDRLMQQLGHVRDYLAARAVPNAVPHDDAWGQLEGQLRTRLLSDKQRQLFDMVLTPGMPEQDIAGDSFELF